MQKLVAVVFLSFLSVAVLAEGKVVVLYPEGAVFATDIAKARLDKLEKNADFAATKVKVDGLIADIKGLDASAQKDGMTWSAEQRAEYEKKMQSLKSEYQFLGKKLQAEKQSLQQQILQEMGPKLDAAIKQLVESENIGLIIDAKSVISGKPENDLTPKVTQLLNKAK